MIKKIKDRSLGAYLEDHGVKVIDITFGTKNKHFLFETDDEMAFGKLCATWRKSQKFRPLTQEELLVTYK